MEVLTLVLFLDMKHCEACLPHQPCFKLVSFSVLGGCLGSGLRSFSDFRVLGFMG